MKKIAVDKNLSNVKRELKDSGYKVVDYREENLKDIAAYVLTGEDNNMMNMEDSSTRKPVINAHGLNASQIRDELDKRLMWAIT